MIDLLRAQVLRKLEEEARAVIELTGSQERALGGGRKLVVELTSQEHGPG